MKKKFCIVIPVYNDWDDVLSSLPVYNEIGLAYLDSVDILFVDNGSDKFPDLSEFNFEVMVCEKPGSYSARNSALKHNLSYYEYFVFTDADCIPSLEWFSSIVKEAEKGFDLLAGDVEVYTDAVNPSYVEAYDIIFGLPQKRYVKKGYAVTANLVISSAVFKNIGLFDDSRFSGGDAEICRRATKNGYELKFSPTAKVYHPARKTWSEIVNKVRRVTGGQTGNGDLTVRLKFLFLNFMPPLRAYIFLLLDKRRVGILNRVKAIVVLTVLWPIRAFESTKSILLGPKVR